MGQYSRCVGKLSEEITELESAMNEGAIAQKEEEFGDVLFSLINLAQYPYISRKCPRESQPKIQITLSIHRIPCLQKA